MEYNEVMVMYWYCYSPKPTKEYIMFCLDKGCPYSCTLEYELRDFPDLLKIVQEYRSEKHKKC